MFYGTTDTDGIHSGGTLFQVTPDGVLTTIYSFCAEADCADGFNPTGGLIVGSEGGLYGTTQGGGTGNGTIFKITPAGALTTLYSFQDADGASPSPLMQDTDGNFYGSLAVAGPQKLGKIFRFSTGLRPFVKTLQTSGKEGSSVIILGSKLTDASAVSFNGATASFTVVSATEITATIPVGATAGKIQVDTPAGSLLSNIPFRVTHWFFRSGIPSLIASLRADAFRRLKPAAWLETRAIAAGSIDCLVTPGLSLKLKLKIIFKMVGAR
jgi:uncharacterized repeat protein (TIGR03803 family)